VVFLSFEPYRGPLTLNLVGDAEAFAELEIGAEVQCSAEQIAFPTIGLTLPLAEAASWHAPLPAGVALHPNALRVRLTTTMQLAARNIPERLLPTQYYEMISGEPASEVRDQVFNPPLRRLQAAIQEGSTEAIARALEAFLGLGAGLTPSGDDLVMGFMLALTRWEPVPSSAEQVATYSLHLLPRALQRTGRLSASLIACACRGQADERLIQALDGLVTGSSEVHVCVSILANWGSSSGFDALTGMVISLLHSPT
jgi:Protein of unknown function (DUF2877)